MRASLFVLLIVLFSGCTSAGGTWDSLPYDYWRLGFLAPDYMEVWVETADVEDIRGQRFFHVGSGTVSVYLPNEDTGWRRGWGKGRYVSGAHLPKRIFVRWQSMAEPQTYRVIIEVPERVRQLMGERLEPPCRTSDYRNALAFGLAPGGVIRGWVMSPCGDTVEVLRAQAEIEPKGPYEGTSGGKHRPLSETSSTYIKSMASPTDPGEPFRPRTRRSSSPSMTRSRLSAGSSGNLPDIFHPSFHARANPLATRLIEAGAPFVFIDDRDNKLALQSELSSISDKLLAWARAGSGSLDLEKERPLRRRHVRLSSNWNAGIGSGDSKFDVVFH